MKQFNLHDALSGKKVVNVNGLPVTDLHLFTNAIERQPLYGILDGAILAWSIDGRYREDKQDSNHDLFMAPEEVIRWANVWKCGYSLLIGNNTTYNDEELAKCNLKNEKMTGAYVGAFPITITL